MATITDYVHHPDGTVSERELVVEVMLTAEQAQARQAAYEVEAHNAAIQAQLDANDLRAIRPLSEAIRTGDTARLEAHEAVQAELRAQLIA